MIICTNLHIRIPQKILFSIVLIIIKTRKKLVGFTEPLPNQIGMRMPPARATGCLCTTWRFFTTTSQSSVRWVGPMLCFALFCSILFYSYSLHCHSVNLFFLPLFFLPVVLPLFLSLFRSLFLVYFLVYFYLSVFLPVCL